MIRTKSTKSGGAGKFLALLASLTMIVAGLVGVSLAGPAAAVVPTTAWTPGSDINAGSNAEDKVCEAAGFTGWAKVNADGSSSSGGTAAGAVVAAPTGLPGKSGTWTSAPGAGAVFLHAGDGTLNKWMGSGTSGTWSDPAHGISTLIFCYPGAPTEYTATKDLNGTVDYCLSGVNGSAPWSVTGSGKSAVSQEDAQTKADADAASKVDAAKAAAIPSGGTAGQCTGEYTATKDLNGTVDYCLAGVNGSAPWSVTGNGASDVSQEDAQTKADADAASKVDAAKAAAIPSGGIAGQCVVTNSFSAPGGSGSYCVNDAIVNVSWAGASGQSSQEGANNIAAANEAAAKKGIPAGSPATCTPVEVTTVETAVVLPATVPTVTVPAKPKPAKVKAPKPAKVDGGFAGTVSAPQAATVPAAVPAGGGSQAPGLPMWALAMIVVGALGAAGAGMQVLGSRK